MRRLVDGLLLACLTASAISSAHASDMPSIPDSPWEVALLLGCLPALGIVPFFFVHLIDRRLRRRDGEQTPQVGRWWLVALLVSLVPWAILLAWFAIQFA